MIFLNRNLNLCYHFQIYKILKFTPSIKLDFKFQLEVYENDLLWYYYLGFWPSFFWLIMGESQVAIILEKPKLKLNHLYCNIWVTKIWHMFSCYTNWERKRNQRKDSTREKNIQNNTKNCKSKSILSSCSSWWYMQEIICLYFCIWYSSIVDIRWWSIWTRGDDTVYSEL